MQTNTLALIHNQTYQYITTPWVIEYIKINELIKDSNIRAIMYIYIWIETLLKRVHI